MLVVQALDAASPLSDYGPECAVLQLDPELAGKTPLGQQVLDAAISAGADEPEQLADFLADLLDADSLLSKTPWHFSRGETQIGALLITFARPFERLVLIDPTAGLDRRRARDLADFIVDLAIDHDVHIYADDPLFSDARLQR